MGAYGCLRNTASVDMERITRKEVVAALRECLDPEININIVDIGLIQGISIDEDNNIKVKITMTSPMCPVASIILADAQMRLEKIKGHAKVELELSWDPLWNVDMISKEIKETMFS